MHEVFICCGQCRLDLGGGAFVEVPTCRQLQLRDAEVPKDGQLKTEFFLARREAQRLYVQRAEEAQMWHKGLQQFKAL